MNYTIREIKHIPSQSYCQQGIKRYQYPKFANENNVVGGSNGSYIVATDSHTNIYVTDDEDGSTFYFDIFYPLKDISNNRRFTKSFISKLNELIANVKVQVDESENIQEKICSTIRNIYNSNNI